jgi:hypothetical protein
MYKLAVFFFLQEKLLKNTEGEPEEVWYKDETSEFQEQLKAYEHMVGKNLFWL